MSLRRGIVGWLVFIATLILLFLLISFIRGEYPGFFHRTAEVKEDTVPGKGFAPVEELTPEEKKVLDDRNIGDALKSGDVNDCDVILDEALRNKCKDNLSYAGIILSGNEDACSAITNDAMRHQCVDQILLGAAMEAFDPKLCEEIQSEALKTKCLNQMQVTVTRTATSTDDCALIRDPLLKQQCMDNVYLATSTNAKTAEGCESIQSGLVQERCKADVAESLEVDQAKEAYIIATANAAPVTAQQALSICDTDACKDKINYNLAFEKKDLSYCNKISDSEMQKLCVQHQTENIDAYYLKAATATKNESLCSKIISAPIQGLCRDSVTN